MKRWRLTITLKSDLCTATGEDTPGIINIKTALEHGIPFIPAKRIKGCLLQSFRELSDNGMVDGDRLIGIFGGSGRDGGEGIHVGDGHLSSVPGFLFEQDRIDQIVVEDYHQFMINLRGEPKIVPLLLEAIFTRRRTRTALEDGLGTAKKHSLHTIQAVPSCVAFSSLLEGELNEKEEEALTLCVKALRHMGLGITRGLGEIHCTLEKAVMDNPSAGGNCFQMLGAYNPEDEVSLSYEIELKLPVVLTGNAGECTDQIPAGAIQGALAGMYISRYALGANAHEDENFCRIFLRDGVQFGNGFLKKGNMEYVPCPKNLAILKEDRTAWFNIAADDNNSRRKNISGLVSLKKDGLYIEKPFKEVHFHHVRPADRGIGHAQNDRAEDTTFPTGQFFQYIALSKGQIFAGNLIGKMKDLQVLMECLEERHFQLMLGKSRTAEYGRCIFQVKEVSPTWPQDRPVIRGKEWCVWLLSPLVYRNPGNGAYDTRKDRLIRQMKETLGCEVKLVEEDSICGYTVLNGYNSKWKLPLAPCPALAEGSAFHIRTEQEIEAHDMEGRRWGILTGKGCGQVKAVPWEQLKEGMVLTADEDEKENCVQHQNPLIDEILKYRKSYLESKDMEAKALQIIDEIKQEMPPSSAISRLIQLLKSVAGNQDFYERIKEEVGQISGEGKRNRLLRFIKPCEEQPIEFMRQYLETAKWKARREE